MEGTILSKEEEERLEAMVGPKDVWQESSDFQIKFLAKEGLQRNDTVLDIGCGVLRGGLPLIRYLNSGCYVGFDIREEVLGEGRILVDKFGLSLKKPLLVNSTTFGKDELGDRTFDYIWVFQVFYHLEDALVDACLAEIKRRLSSSGRCFFNVNGTTPGGRWKEFPFVKKEPSFYVECAAKHEMRAEVIGQLKDFGYTDKVPGYFHHMLRLAHT